MTRLRPALLMLLIVLAYGFVGAMDYADEQRIHERKCDMARLWVETEGRDGWPPGDGYEELCGIDNERI